MRTLSGGQQRRLDLALGLIGDPDLLFLDEPTTGFDPSARRQAWELVRRMGALGKTVLLTTHYMEEAQALADRVVVIVGGREGRRRNAGVDRRAGNGGGRRSLRAPDRGSSAPICRSPRARSPAASSSYARRTRRRSCAS